MDDYMPSFTKYFSFKHPYSETLRAVDVYPMETETNGPKIEQMGTGVLKHLVARRDLRV